ncbi:anthranilate synthase component 1 [Staphylococcus chromogenes]|nr:anthranilate synthase component 1 [Staphylococcus chromogenes]
MKLRVPYADVADVGAVFQHSGGDALLESADIGTRSIAVLRSAARIRCDGQSVYVTGTSEVISYLDETLGEYGKGGEYRFPRSTALNERARLTSISNIEPLRLLQKRDKDALLVGGFAFDFLETFEELPPVPPGANTFPDYEFVLAEVTLEVDHAAEVAYLQGPGADLPGIAQQLNRTTARGVGSVVAKMQTSDAEFAQQVRDLQEHIHAGDVFQVVPSRVFSSPCPDAFAAYRRLKTHNPAPYLFYIRGQGYELFGASPESSLKYTAATRRVELYPIAGTQPRGTTHEEDIRRELLLRTDAKEIAEHTMLVDLARNDLARVCKRGTRKVEKLMQVDRYSKVMHLVSLVAGELDEGLDALDAYRACMNMGTLTGAPKLRAVELLRGVEKQRRGAYGGAVGYLRGNGDMDTCIVIRSAFVAEGVAHVQAGAGVVRDSVPEAEAAETEHKARAVLEALGA